MLFVKIKALRDVRPYRPDCYTLNMEALCAFPNVSNCVPVNKKLHFTRFEYCKSKPVTGLDRPGGFHEFEAPRFQENRHMKVIELSALRTGRLYSPGNIPGTHIC